MMGGNGLTLFAWTFMLLSMGAVTWLTVWCFYRIFTSGSAYGTQEEGFGDAGPTAQVGSG